MKCEKFYLACCVLAAACVLACSDGDNGPSRPQPGDSDTEEGEGEENCEQIPVPEVPAQHGVAYSVHYHSPELRVYRTDGEFPRQQEKVLDTGGVNRTLALDPENNLLALVGDARIEKQFKVTLYRTFLPASVEEDVPLPRSFRFCGLTRGSL